MPMYLYRLAIFPLVFLLCKGVGEKTYIDVLSLQKMDDQWKIANKMYIEL